MLSLFKLLFSLIDIDSETVLTWFGLGNSNMSTSSTVSFKTLNLIIEGFWEKIYDGLTLSDIENVLFFILFIRFLILSFRYNIKTSFYITGIGFIAGYLWYRHLIDLIFMYRTILVKLPLFNRLGEYGVQMRYINEQMVLTDLKLRENVHWYNPAQILYSALKNGMMQLDTETGIRYYIDPVSMIVSNLNEPIKSIIFPIYYKFSNIILPKLFNLISKFWSQLSGIAAYAIITRMGKRYCPYLIRWHWTFILVIRMLEQIFIHFIYRAHYFQTSILIPQSKAYEVFSDPNIALQINIINGFIASIVLTHIGFIIFGLLHAICGQYFYFPFLVENTELHVGLRPINSIYSGGHTSWQEFKEKNLSQGFPKLWYGWFGYGTSNYIEFRYLIQRLIRKIFKNIK